MSTLKSVTIVHPSSAVNNIVNDASGNVAVGGTLTSSTITSATATALTIKSAGTTAMTIDTSQNVGIGTTSPAYRLHVKGGNTGNMAVDNGGQQYTELDYLNNGTLKVASYWDNTNANFFTYTAVSGSLAWGISGAEKMRIDSSGNVLVGTTSGTDRLIVKSAGTSSAASAITVQNSAGTELLRVRNDGVFYTGGATFSPYNNTTGLAANVFVGSSGDLYRSTSSLRYKINVQDYGKGLSDLAKLRPVTFQSKPKENDELPSTQIYAGFIAEEVDAAGFNEFVFYDVEGRPDAVHYGNMVALMAKAIQELSAKNDALEARLAALEAK